ncbi:MAG: FtsH protease activity modulator HflK [Thiotrichales bacterium]
MPWNQPGDDQKDPWGGGGGGGRKDGPPDLDELLKKLGIKFGGLKGMKGGGGASRSSIIGLLVIGALIWLASGFYIVGEGERGIELRFGAAKTVTRPGPHWHLPFPIETVEKVDIDQVRSYQHRASMLTQDENIVDIELAVQYRVKDPMEYVFQVRFPDATMQDVVQSALREAVGKSDMDYVLNEGRAQIAAKSRELTQAMLDGYGTGLEVTTVNLQQSQPPEAVQEAFNDAIKAREDNVRFVNEAEAYANGIVPLARGEAARMVEEATAFKEQVVSRATGDASRFSQINAEYAKAPEVTRRRLYLETVESVLGSTSKVVVDTKQGNSLMYLPLDKMMQGHAPSPEAMSSRSSQASGMSTSPSSPGAQNSAAGRSSERGLREVR